MKQLNPVLIFVFCVFGCVSLVSATAVQGSGDPNRVEHHSLESPFIRDWWQGGVPYWDFGGATVVTDKYIRIAPDKQSRSGWLWNTEPSNLDNWEMTVLFRIHSHINPGADGMAVWYTDRHHTPDTHSTGNRNKGEIWGNNAEFTGLGLIFDTYDNDGARDNPGIAVIKGDGKDPKWDLSGDLKSQALLRCNYEYRNTHGQVQARVTYGNKQLKVFLSIPSEDSKEMQCGHTIQDLELPKGYYFGVTAATGHLADNHDLHALIIRSNKAAAEAEDSALFDKEHKQDEGEQGSHKPKVQLPDAVGKATQQAATQQAGATIQQQQQAQQGQQAQQ